MIAPCGRTSRPALAMIMRGKGCSVHRPSSPNARRRSRGLLTCRGGSTNVPTHFCDHRVDNLVAQADDLQSINPEESSRVWASIDLLITDRGRAPTDELGCVVSDYAAATLTGPGGPA